MVVLVEADFKAATQGVLNGDRDKDSGGFVFHLALGFQINITNRVEVKWGVDAPFTDSCLAGSSPTTSGYADVQLPDLR